MLLLLLLLLLRLLPLLPLLLLLLLPLPLLLLLLLPPRWLLAACCWLLRTQTGLKSVTSLLQASRESSCSRRTPRRRLGA